jgi:very-short-patch-repair endonuclease
VQRMIRESVDRPLAELFLQSTLVPDLEGEGAARARSSVERFLYQRLETMPGFIGLFGLNQKIPIAFDAESSMEIDLYSKDLKLAIEIDGPQHLNDRDAYRRDRRKDILLQQSGILVLRFLADDISKQLDRVLDTIATSIAYRERSSD